MDFKVPVVHRGKINESEKIDKTETLLENEKTVKLAVKVKQIVIGVLWTIPKSLEKGLEEEKSIEESRTSR